MADVGVDDATQVVEDLFANREESEFNGVVDSVRITIAEDQG